MCSANARPGAPGGIDCQHLSERLGVRTQGAFPWAYSRLRIGVRIFTQLGGFDPNIYPARRAAQACAAAPPSLLDALRCQGGWEACICESPLTEIIPEKRVSESKPKRKISLRHCIHTGKPCAEVFSAQPHSSGGKLAEPLPPFWWW